jgi:hypothetical protein
VCKEELLACAPGSLRQGRRGFRSFGRDDRDDRDGRSCGRSLARRTRPWATSSLKVAATETVFGDLESI